MSTRRVIIPTVSAFVVILAGAGIAAATRDVAPAPEENASRAPIYELARVSNVDADRLDAHAAAMEHLAATRPAHAQWSSQAAEIRVHAGTLRFVGQSALAIANDRGSNPDTSVEVRRVLGDGLNLDQLGSIVLEEADAIESHLVAMRAEATGDTALLALIDASVPDLRSTRRDGEAAVARGKNLQQIAISISESTGQALPGP